MTEPAPPADPLATIRAVAKEMEATRAEIVNLRNYGRRNRKFILFDVGLTVLLTALGGGVVHAIQSAGHANSAQLALCQAGNVSRAQQINLWTFLINLSPPPKTKQGKELITKFEAHLRSTFAPRNCEALGQK
jgi:hypothetical protein